MRPRPRRALAVVPAALAASVALAGGVRHWSPSPAALGEGEAIGVAVSSLGRLSAAPGLSRLGDGPLPGAPVHVFAMVGDRAGNLYLGTGPDGRIVQVTPSGRHAVHYTIEEPLVTALAVGPGGELYAGASPGGTIYRIDGEGRGERFAETEERYVWALAFDSEGRLHAGTGESGAVLRISRSGGVEPWFDSDEAHIVTLVALPGGGMLAGGSGRGQVYSIDDEGHPITLHDDDLDQVTALLPVEDGAIVAAFLRAPDPPAEAPAVKIRMPDGVVVGAASQPVASLEDEQDRSLRGVIEGLRPEAGRPAGPPRGRVVRIDRSGATRELWRSTTEAPFCLGRDRAGQVIFGAGEPGRLYAVGPDGDVLRLTTLVEAQVTAVARVGEATFLATSSPAGAFRLESGRDDTGLYLSAPFDAGIPSRWGSIRWQVEGDPGTVEIYTRTGNSRAPDATWSGWSPLARVPGGSPIDNPAGRFLQWRARFPPGGATATRISGVRVGYSPLNRPPELRGPERVGPAARDRIAFEVTVRDEDGDALDVLLQARPAGDASAAWIERARAALEPAAAGDPGAWRPASIVWDLGAASEGRYDLQLFVTDEPANHPGDGVRVPLVPASTLVVDRTPPSIEWSDAGGGDVAAVVSDAHSGVARVEVVAGGRTRFAPRPEDGACDSGRERFVFAPPAAGEPWSLVAHDAAGNRAEREAPP